ncbi:Rieske (2Fe-2S) protein [Streptomyces mirabilis]|jgi:Rieske Fe-S protein|uniref:Cytochrome bc1 complex Rieske iron-sulfur subunit n=1 Tax=Streptomyces mirabilis TaxID=68239 RepID=A0A1I2GXV4_9ACTN|nr:Rieske (2Fe-2S) protein [Streptomyces mirabilis]SFF22078.1 Ferredoxin subunit of nitrite reductase or a ring-hydroxylating dioxygenase [Streptomyces mirabilis]
MTNPPARRTVLGTGAAFLLAGCSKYGDSNSSSAASPTATTSPIASSKPSAGKELAEKSDIPVGGGKIFKEEKVVVTQPKKGEFKAFSAICTHQGCTVNKVADGTIDCPCHGSKYRITDASVVHGPAPRPLPAKKITVKGKSIFLA